MSRISLSTGRGHRDLLALSYLLQNQYLIILTSKYPTLPTPFIAPQQQYTKEQKSFEREVDRVKESSVIHLETNN